MITTLTIVALSILLGVVGTLLLRRSVGRGGRTEVSSHWIAQQIRSVGKLVGLEVMSKEIVTQTRGLSWLPPLLLSQARLAMIFAFEKRYYIDLSRLSVRDVEPLGGGRYRVTLPPIEGSVHLLEVTPYDIQAGKLLGLVDVFRMDAPAQKDLMDKAQTEAERLYEGHWARYEHEARRAIEQQMASLLSLFDVDLEVRFSDQGASEPTGAKAVVERVGASLAAAASAA